MNIDARFYLLATCIAVTVYPSAWPFLVWAALNYCAFCFEKVWDAHIRILKKQNRLPLDIWDADYRRPPNP